MTDACSDNEAWIWGQVANGDGSVSVDGAAGDDEISAEGDHGTGAAVGTCGEDEIGVSLKGSAGNDDIQGGNGNDVLSGGAGDDTLDGNDSGETESGAECDVDLDISTGQLEDVGDLDGDWVDYSGAAGPMTVDLDPGEKSPGTATGEGTDTLQNIENIIGSVAGDTLSGDNVSNLILGLPGDDTISGDAGNDCEWGNDGNDTFNENEGTSVAEGGAGTNNGSDLMIGGAGWMTRSATRPARRGWSSTSSPFRSSARSTRVTPARTDPTTMLSSARRTTTTPG